MTSDLNEKPESKIVRVLAVQTSHEDVSLPSSVTLTTEVFIVSGGDWLCQL